MPRIPTKDELRARGFSDSAAEALIKCHEIMDEVSEGERQMILAMIASRYLDSTGGPPGRS